MPLPLQVAFVAGSSGIWRIERITAVAGESLPPAEPLAVIEGPEAHDRLKAAGSCEAQRAIRATQTEKNSRP